MKTRWLKLICSAFCFSLGSSPVVEATFWMHTADAQEAEREAKERVAEVIRIECEEDPDAFDIIVRADDLEDQIPTGMLFERPMSIVRRG